MKKEVTSAVDFLVDLLRLSSDSSVTELQLRKFKEHVCDLLWSHYKDHWFPEKPLKGSGYRCIRINGKMDPLIAQAGATMGMSAKALRNLFPSELTMWIDPMEVSYRIGENGSICVLYGDNEPISEVQTKSNSKQQQQQQQQPTPTKTPPAPAPHRVMTSPVSALHYKRFTPSKAPLTPPPFHSRQPPSPSPPNSPLTPPPNNQMSLQQQQQILFLMNSHSGNCKDSFRTGSALDSVRNMERLFVSS